MTKSGFYLDENVPLVVADQIRNADIVVYSAHELGFLGAPDHDHLNHAIIRQCVLCTHDTYFLILAKTELQHYGILWSPHAHATIGGWVRALRQIHADETTESLMNQVRILSTK